MQTGMLYLRDPAAFRRQTRVLNQELKIRAFAATLPPH